MAIQKEPGQKGVNWSNIAVGKRAVHFSRLVHETNSLVELRCYNEYGIRLHMYTTEPITDSFCLLVGVMIYQFVSEYPASICFLMPMFNFIVL